MINPLLAIDFYKADRRRQYPEGTTKEYSNFTPRSNRLYRGKSDKVVVVGIQMLIKDYLIKSWNEGFFQRDIEDVIAEYKTFMDCALGQDAIPVDHIRDLHNLGYLPIEIKALTEGELCPMKVPVLTITNTLPNFFWLVNYLETVISTELWKPMTNATIAYEYRQTFNEFAERTGANKDFILFQGHDFSARGLSNREDGYKSGIAHLTSFVGTDTVLAIQGAKDFYNADYTKELVGTSVPATEHSVMCMGSKDGEFETYKRLITELYPSGVVSIVSDTWDLWKVLTEYTPMLKEEILNRKENSLGLAKVVFRPDSGNPVDIICGTVSDALIINPDWYEKGNFEQWQDLVGEDIDDIFRDKLGSVEPIYNITLSYLFDNDVYQVTYTPDLNRNDKTYYYVDNYGPILSKCDFKKINKTPISKGAVEILWDIFGGTINDKGFKTLNQRVGLIYGDGITLERQREILTRLEAKGFASDNIVFGIGSYTYQYSTRDTFGFAMKATYCEVDGKGREIFKDPITDSGTKKSAKGLLFVKRDEPDGDFYLIDQVSADREQSENNNLKLVFKDGKLLRETTLSEIRQRLHK